MSFVSPTAILPSFSTRTFVCPSLFSSLVEAYHIPCFHFTLPQRLGFLPVVNLKCLASWTPGSHIGRGVCINRFCILSSVPGVVLSCLGFTLKSGRGNLTVVSRGSVSACLFFLIFKLSSSLFLRSCASFGDVLPGSGVIMYHGMPVDGRVRIRGWRIVDLSI